MILLRQGFAVLMLATTMFGATESVSIDTKTKKIQNPIVNFGAGNTLNGTGATIIGFPGSSYTFIDSLTQSAGNVSLVNDSASPGNSKYYGTDSGGVLGFHTVTGGGGTFIDLDFTDSISVGYLVDANNTVLGLGAFTGVTTGNSNTIIGTGAGANIADGVRNVIIGSTSDVPPTIPGSSGITLVGYSTGNETPSDFNATAIGFNARVTANNRFVAGNLNLTDFYAGSESGHATVHAAGYDIGNTPLAASDVGAIPAIADPNANRLFGWDDTDNAYSFFTIGSGLTYTHSTHTVSVSTPTPTATATPTATFTPTATPTATATATATPTPSATATAFPQGFTAHFSRGGAALQVNDVTLTPWTTKYPGTITGFIISADQGTCTLKVWKKATGTAIPTIADVINTSGVSLATGTHIDSTTVSDFTTTTVSIGDQFMAQITAVSGGATDITFQIPIRQ